MQGNQKYRKTKIIKIDIIFKTNVKYKFSRYSNLIVKFHKYKIVENEIK